MRWPWLRVSDNRDEGNFPANLNESLWNGPSALNFDSRADAGEKNLVGKLCMQQGRTKLSGTV